MLFRSRTRQPERKPIAIYDLLNYIAGLAKARVSEKEISLQVECDEQLSCDIDASQMQQAILNLLTNAINASPPDSRIKLGAASRDTGTVIYVENMGPAIPANLVERVFEPFFTSGANGTGLGLSIVRNIARAHDGEVSLAVNEQDNIRFEIVF